MRSEAISLLRFIGRWFLDVFKPIVNLGMAPKEMKFAIQVQDLRSTESSADTCYQFITAILNSGHEVVRIFFYSDGILNAFPPHRGSASERSMAWSALAKQGVDLVFCSTAAERRGFKTETSSSPNHLQPYPGFRPGGLGLWMDALLKADRIIVFGA